MKFNILIAFSLFLISCSAQSDKESEDNNFILSYEMDGQLITDTIEISDGYKNAIIELEKMIKNPNYRPSIKNDTIINNAGNPIVVILNSDIFGAQIERFKYNKNEQLASITGFNKAGQVSPFDKNIAIQTYEYNEYGSITEINNYKEDGTHISAEYETTPIIKKVYNEKQQQIEEWYLNENRELRDPFAIAKFEFDENGTEKFIGWFNEKGEMK